LPPISVLSWPPAERLIGALICLAAIFLAVVLLVMGALPFPGDELRRGRSASGVARRPTPPCGLSAPFYQPVWTTGIANGPDFALATTAFLLLFMWQTPPGWWSSCAREPER